MKKEKNFVYKLVKPIYSILLKIIFRPKVIGKENIPKDKKIDAKGLTTTEAITPKGEQVPKPTRQIGEVISWAPRDDEISLDNFLGKILQNKGKNIFCPKSKPIKAQ